MAKRTLEIRGKFLPLVDIAADLAAPYCFFRFDRRGRGLDMRLIIRIGRRGQIIQPQRVLNLRNEERVAAEIFRGDDAAGKNRGGEGKIAQTV